MRTCFTSLVIFISVGLMAQTLTNGPLTEIHDLEPKPSISGFDEENIFLTDMVAEDVFPSGFQYYLYAECLDKKTLEVKYQKEYEMNIDFSSKAAGSLETVLYQDGYLNYFVSVLYYKENRKELLVYRIDLKTGEELPPDTLLRIEYGETKTFVNTSKYHARVGFFNFHTSKDKKRLLIHNKSRNSELGKTYEKLYVFDSDLKLIKEKEFVSDKEEGLIPKGLIIDNEGSIYYMEEEEFVFLDFYQDYEEWKEVIPKDVMESNAKVKRLTGSFKEDGNLIIVGHYVTEDLEETNENKEGRETEKGDTQVEGVLFMEVDGFNKEIKQVMVSKFDEEYIKEYTDDMHVRKKVEPEINDVFTEFTLRFTDSMTFVIGEVSGLMDDGYMRGDLAVYAFNKQGQLQWAHRIGKRQLGRVKSLNTTGFLPFLDDENLYILFNDDGVNLEDGKRPILEFEELNDDDYAVPILYTFDMKSGEFDYQIKTDWLIDEDTKLLPYFGRQLKNSEPIYIFQKSRKERGVSRITLD